MKKCLLFFSFLLIASTVHSQHYSHYNTGTLYESFENPAQQTFIPDSSRKYAFNLFIPNFGADFFLSGNSQTTLKSRAFIGTYDDTKLSIGGGRYNRARGNANVYFIMYKAFTNLNSNGEIGFSVQSQVESRGLFSDESPAIFNGSKAFDEGHYDNILNNSFSYQAYHQISFSYREKVSKQFALGVKLSALLGIQYQKLNITQSSADVNKLDDNTVLALAGKYDISYTPGGFTVRDNLPTLRNPGASISVGTSLRTRDNFYLQGNLKNLGFIRWNSRSFKYVFNGIDTIRNQSTNDNEDNAYGAAYNIIHLGGKTGAFITPTNAQVQLSANKSYFIDDDKQFRYSPTLIGSKELFYSGLEIAIVNPVQYKNTTVSITSSYNNYRIFSLGGQLMIKSPNAEFFIGSEKLLQSGRFLQASQEKNTEINRSSYYSGANIFLGFSLKFGSVIEHPMNASFVPLKEQKGFFADLWGRIFKHTDDN